MTTIPAKDLFDLPLSDQLGAMRAHLSDIYHATIQGIFDDAWPSDVRDAFPSIKQPWAIEQMGRLDIVAWFERFRTWLASLPPDLRERLETSEVMR